MNLKIQLIIFLWQKQQGSALLPIRREEDFVGTGWLRARVMVVKVPDRGKNKHQAGARV